MKIGTSTRIVKHVRQHRNELRVIPTPLRKREVSAKRFPAGNCSTPLLFSALACNRAREGAITVEGSLPILSMMSIFAQVGQPRCVDIA